MTKREKMVSILDELSQKIETTQASETAKATEISEEIARAKSALADAENRKALANENDDLEAFRSASHDIVDNQATIEYFSNKAQEESGALLSESEYEKTIQDLKEAFSELQLEDAKALIPLLENVLTIGAAEEEIFSRANNLIRSLSYDVMHRERNSYCPQIVADLPIMLFSEKLRTSSNRSELALALEEMKKAVAEDEKEKNNNG